MKHWYKILITPFMSLVYYQYQILIQAKTEPALQSLDLSAGFKFGRKTEVIISIPKFKIESSHDLNDPLKGLGMSSMFDQGTADFSRMSDASQLYMSSVVQVILSKQNAIATSETHDND